MLREKWFKSSARVLMLMPVQCTNRMRGHWTSSNLSANALGDLNHFSSNKTYACIIDLIHTRQKNKSISSCSRNIIGKKIINCHWSWRIFNNFTQWKNGSVDVSLCDDHARGHGCFKRLSNDFCAKNVIFYLTGIWKPSANNKKCWKFKV